MLTVTMLTIGCLVSHCGIMMVCMALAQNPEKHGKRDKHAKLSTLKQNTVILYSSIDVKKPHYISEASYRTD
jgi:hypothetical protein